MKGEHYNYEIGQRLNYVISEKGIISVKIAYNYLKYFRSILFAFIKYYFENST